MSPETLVIRVDASTTRDRCRGDEVVVHDPRVAFAMLLDLERRRRGGESIPRVSIVVATGGDADFERAIARHVPWVEVIKADRMPVRSIQSIQSDRPDDPVRSVPVSGAAVAPTVSADELAMLFEGSGSGPPPTGPMTGEFGPA